MASSVDLGNQLESFVTQLVKTGRYNSRSEILREGVRLIHERETKLAALDASIMRGIASADTGRVHELDDVAAKLDAKYAKMATDRRSQ
ncbi:putative antitoxin [Sphingomonas changbaiensis NBRC 104936]|uniref:Putative antitoxin n=1 Tax=Sphingomonas changbaiensis NBRC 104936 TaxID=1219043 RepID=A0A0E9ML73_9SPHN|nr:type II toxin-antitoxin system ParD family antitoxin [Sphingomonas changbaiensis]GAO38289.1 putative antitoxin [Sphingomonas changbaiensis NBRC 104936]